MTNEEKYKTKENYKQPFPDINSQFWNENITGVLINYYKNYFKGNVAEFGCNNGISTVKVSKYENVEKVIGFDINEEAIKEAQEMLMPQIPQTSHKVTFIKTNLTDINWQKEYFDFAFTIHTIEHIYPEDIELAIEQMSSLLKPNAYFLVNLPDKNSYHWEPTHVFHPDLNELNSLFVKKGFEVVEGYHDERGGQVGHSRNITALYKKI